MKYNQILSSPRLKRTLTFGDSEGTFCEGNDPRLNPGLIFGVREDLASNTPTVAYVNLYKDVIPKPKTEFFENHPIFKGIYRCNVADDGTVNAVYGDASFAYDGSNGQVMTRFGKYWYREEFDGDYRYRWASPIPIEGFEVSMGFYKDDTSPRRELDEFFIGTFTGCVFDVTADAYEVNTIAITNAATESGNLTITLDGHYAFTVAVDVGDDTPTKVADKIRAAGNKTDSFGVEWVVSGADENVIYTADTPGLKNTVTMPEANGVTRTITKTTTGKGGYTTHDAAGVDFTATSGDKLSSVAGVLSASGMNNSLHIVNSRVLAKNRGDGWQLVDGEQLAAIQTLFMFRYGTRHSQSIYRGVCDEATGTRNHSHFTGFSAGSWVAAGGEDAGNAGWENTSKASGSREFSALAVENFYGNLWWWVDGINIRGSPNWGEVWVCNHTFESNKFSTPYINYGTVVNTNAAWQYIKSMLPGQLMIPDAHQTNAAHYYCDGIYTRATSDVTARVVPFGGRWSSADLVGASCLPLDNDSTSANRAIGARIAFVKPSV